MATSPICHWSCAGSERAFCVTFAADALQEISGYFKRTSKVIVPLTVREIVDEQIAMEVA